VGDFGRDVLAVKRGLGIVRVIDQVKAYGPSHLVTADDVRALLGVTAWRQSVQRLSDHNIRFRSEAL
jgi:hypothetical protein